MARTKRQTKRAAQIIEAGGVRFPLPVGDPRKLADGKLARHVAAHLAAVEQVENSDDREVIRSGQADAVLTGLRRSVESLEALRAEQSRRAEEQAFEAETARLERRSFWDALRGQPPAKERAEAWERHEREQEEARRARRARLEAARAEEARHRHADRVRAGLVYEPLGGWDFDGSDAIAAVFGSSLLWEYLDKRGEGPVLDVHDLAFLHTCLALIAENGGEAVSLRLDRFPRLPEGFHGDRNALLRHLEANRLLSVERQGVNVTIRRGPLVEQLRESFRQQWRERAA